MRNHQHFYFMKTIKTTEGNKIYKTFDDVIFMNKKEALLHEKKEKKLLAIQNAFATVYNNSDEVLKSLLEGLRRMLETDRRTILNGLKYLLK
jgi:hypothetical protein